MKRIFLLLAIPFLLTTPVLAQETRPATEYQLLAPLPNVETTPGSGKTNAGQYISGIFTLIIAIAGALAVLVIIFGGIKYMSTDAFGEKSEAKDIIQNAIWGLLLAMSAWLILYTINPNLVKFDLKIPVQKIATSTGPGGGPIGSGPDDLPLTQQQALDTFAAAGVTVAGPIKLAGIRQGIVDEVIRLKNACNCAVVVTSATGGEHAPGTCSHANGYKVDLRSQAEGTATTNYITSTYQRLPDRSDGARIYRSPTGGIYALENDHWDVAKC